MKTAMVMMACMLFATPVLGQSPDDQAPTPVPKGSAGGSAAWTDPSAQARCRAAAAYSDSKNGHALLVMHDGKVVFEHYHGWSAERPHPLASGTKSFCGIAAALAVADGLLTLDEPVARTITEWASDPVKSSITVRQVLSLSAGLAPMDRELQGARSTDRGAAALTAPQAAAPGERFIYGPSSFYVFGELMERKLAAAKSEHSNVQEYLEARIFKPLGITARFGQDAHGNPNLPGGCMVTARDWAIFGELIRNRGAHNGRELVKPELLAEVLAAHGPNPRYGLTWWLLREGDGEPEADVRAGAGGRLGRDRRGSMETDRGGRAELSKAEPGQVLGVMAAGLGKQRLYVLPEHALTIVRFGELRGEARPPLDDRELFRLLMPEQFPTGAAVNEP